MNELVSIEKENTLEIFTAKNGLDPFMAKIKTEVDCFVPDLSTAKGRKEIASMAMKVAKSKTYLDNAGKELVSKLKEQPKLVDAERKRMRDALDSWKEEVRKPLTDWENKEKERVAAHEYGLKNIRTLAHGYIDEFNSSLKSLNQLEDSLDRLDQIEIGECWEEFEAKALLEKTKGQEKLRELIEKEEVKLAEQQEIERIAAEKAAEEKKQREEKIAKEASEKAKQESEAKAKAEKDAIEAKAKADREAAEKRETELKLEAEQAKRRALEAEENARREAEAEKQREIDQATEREKNKKHKASINNFALEAFIAGGMDKKDAKLAVELIAKKTVPNVVINY